MTTDEATLVLRFTGPMQSWGTSSRFTERTTGREPSKSGVIGLLAAAQGRLRQDPIEDLLDLRMGVRVDVPGRVVIDFQTAVRPAVGKKQDEPMPLSRRHYLCDAKFLVAVNGERQMLEGLRDALLAPRFPLSLGRRSCPPAGKLVDGVRSQGLAEVLETDPWLGSFGESSARRGSLPTDRRQLAVVRDLLPSEDHGKDGGSSGMSVDKDIPVSFDPKHRQYGWRRTKRYFVDCPGFTTEAQDDLDFFDLIGE